MSKLLLVSKKNQKNILAYFSMSMDIWWIKGTFNIECEHDF